ncbi:MAG: hypothetical protein QOF25_2764 [Mycobacterium sp.]|jgi:deazaflavin-dependent oxidoreductase (nitroreductase family)|nr:hypothetical protein [Mycobacterium sp.]
MNLIAENNLDGVYVPSPVERIREQVADYEASGGVEGATLEGRPVVILTSVGVKSGKVRKNPVMRIVDGDRYVAVASAAGAPANPSWYANLVAHPRVRLQDGASVMEFQAREVSGDEKRHYWNCGRAILAALSRVSTTRRRTRHPDHGARTRRAAYVRRQSSRGAQQGVGAGGVRHVVQSA